MNKRQEIKKSGRNIVEKKEDLRAGESTILLAFFSSSFSFFVFLFDTGAQCVIPSAFSENAKRTSPERNETGGRQTTRFAGAFFLLHSIEEEKTEPTNIDRVRSIFLHTCTCFVIILCIIIMFDSVLFRYIFKYEFKGSSKIDQDTGTGTGNAHIR